MQGTRSRPSLRAAAAAIAAVVALAGSPAGAGAAAVSAAGAGPAVGAGAREAAWASTNWAGYVVAGGPYTSVSGSWVVPAVSPSARPTFAALWLGIDGVDAASLIQAGTEQDYYGGAAHYSAWWEILPAPAVQIRTVTVRPGDTIRASIAQVSPGRWRISVSDARGGHFTTTRAYAGAGTSAEWIEEAPVVGRRIAPLARTSVVRFDHAAVNGMSAALTRDEGVVLARGSTVLLTPSAPDADHDGFALRAGAAVPGAPPS